MGAPAVAPRPRAPAPSRRAPAKRPPTGPAKRAPARRVRTAAPRRSPARSAPRPNLRPNPAFAGVGHAAVRTAGAVRDISDSSLIVRLTAGRGWIAVLCALLAGIVFLNVLSLSLNAGSSRVSQQVADLERSNSALRGELAERLSASRVEDAAPGLGLYSPPGDDITYLKARDGATDELLALISNDTVLTDDAFVPLSTQEAGATAYQQPAAPTAEAPAATELEPAQSEPAPAPPAPAPSSPPRGAAGGVGL